MANSEILKYRNYDKHFRGDPIWRGDIGERTGQQFQEALEKQGSPVTPWANALLEGKDFQKPHPTEAIKTIRLRLRAIGITEPVWSTGYFRRLAKQARENGLLLCPKSTGPEIALTNTSIIQPGESAIILSEPIASRTYGRRHLFVLDKVGDGLRLNGYAADGPFGPDRIVICRLPA